MGLGLVAIALDKWLYFLHYNLLMLFFVVGIRAAIISYMLYLFHNGCFTDSTNFM
jgi:hypothetical protein